MRCVTSIRGAPIHEDTPRRALQKIVPLRQAQIQNPVE